MPGDKGAVVGRDGGSDELWERLLSAVSCWFGGRRSLRARPRPCGRPFGAEFELESSSVAVPVPSETTPTNREAVISCSFPTQKSQNTQPKIVHRLPQLTTDTGLTRS